MADRRNLSQRGDALRADEKPKLDPKSEDAGFFDDYPVFAETSETANDLRRLNWRYRLLIARQAALLAGARVLDIASHDGRWSFAALKTGASHVTGVEFRPDLVANANATFEGYRVDPASYRFLTGDLFEVLERPAEHDIAADVVLCLGFLYHTLRYPELLLGIRRLAPRAVILDTAVTLNDTRTVWLVAEDTDQQYNAARTKGNYNGVLLTGRPSVPALRYMLDAYGFEVVDEIDWRAEGPRFPGRQQTKVYAEGRRVTWVVRPV